jgi:hypothetical protein
VLSAEECAGKPKGRVVQWHSLGSSPFATIPLRCGAKGEFGLLKILGKHPEPTLDADIADTLTNYDHEQQQSPTSVAYSRSDLPPCPGHFRVVVQFEGYGSTGIKGIITAFHSPDPAPGHPRVPNPGPDIVRAAARSCWLGRPAQRGQVSNVSEQLLGIAEEPTPEEFDPADTVHRVAGELRGKHWPTVTRGELEVIAAKPVSTKWPISVRLTVEGEHWSAAREFLVEFGWESTFPGNGPENNAQGLADDGMILIEEYLETGLVERLTEMTRAV